MKFNISQSLSIFQSIGQMFFPKLCLGCGDSVLSGTTDFCTQCRNEIQFFKPRKENEITERLWGKVRLEAAASLYYFKSGSPVQRAIHQLKYRHNMKIGLKMGNAFGKILKNEKQFAGVDIIIPVPLHPKKERTRGYNQSEVFAEGISQTFEKQVITNVLLRGVMAESQTQMGRLERHENASDLFYTKNESKISGKGILLVDDVLTTGATIENCAKLLTKIPGTTIFIGTIATAIR